jgi:hypothetical protein
VIEAAPADPGAPLDATILAMTRRARADFRLSAREWLVLLTIVTAAVQRYVRAPEADPRYLDATPLPLHLSGRISRRRVAEVTGLAPESVRRVVLRLMAADLVREEDGGLHSRPGILGEMSASGLVDELLELLCRCWGGGLRIVAPRMRDQARPIAYRIGNVGLSWLVSLQRQHALSPAAIETLLILMERPDGERLSERALAAEVLIPRETLRRHVSQFAARGLVEHTPAGPRIRPEARAKHLQHPEARERQHLSDQLRQDLLRMGVVEAAA